MKYFQLLITWLLLFTTPTVCAYPQSSPIIPQIQQTSILQRLTTYDEILEFFDQLVSGELEEKCSDEDWEDVLKFMEFVMHLGDIFDGDENIEALEESLLDSASFAFQSDHTDFKVMPCRSWFKKAGKELRRGARRTVNYVKKHPVKSALVVAGCAVGIGVGIEVFSGAVGTVAAASTASSSQHSSHESQPSVATMMSSPGLQSVVEDHASNMKNALLGKELLTPSTNQFYKEAIRELGSISAHQYTEHLYDSQRIHVPDHLVEMHQKIDRFNSTHHPHSNQPVEFDYAAHQVLANKAFEARQYQETIRYADKAIEWHPEAPAPYLDRSLANLALGNYDKSIQDYHQYAAKTPSTSSNIATFSVAVAKGIPRGAIAGGKAWGTFAKETLFHPIQTAQELYNGITTLVGLVGSAEWTAISQTLVPEVHDLVTHWDTLDIETRGENTGYIFGKYGAEIVLYAGSAKAIGSGISAAKTSFQTAEKTCIMEGTLAATTKAPVYKPVEVSPRSIAQFQKTEQFLERYKGIPLTEQQAKAILHARKIETFPRPAGIPDNYKIQFSNKGAGIKYVHPQDNGTYVRVMPGKPHSPHPCQQRPYVTHQKNGHSLDKFGNIVLGDVPAAHIPMDEFIYRGN